MRRALTILFLLLDNAAATPLRAAPNAIASVLEQQRQHGFAAPAQAIADLTALAADAADAPLPLRMDYHNALAALYIAAEQPEQVRAELGALARMATAERCQPCGVYRLVRELQQAIRQQDVALAARLLRQLDPVAQGEPRLMQAVHYARAAALDSAGSHARAIDEAIQASKLALQTDNPAEQVRSLNLLMLANIGRRDLAQAEQLARDAYQLAERIGFIYMMSYVRGNEAWIYSLKGEPDKQLRALNEALQITRAHPGLADSELVNLVNLAEYYNEQKAYRQAANAAGEAVRLAARQHKPTAQGVAQASLGRALVELGEPERGIATAQEAVALLTKAGAKSYVVDATDVLAQVYERSGRYREANQVLRQLLALKEAATVRDREKAVAEAQQKFSLERKDHEIERLSLENGVRRAEVAARAWQQRLWAMAALALALSAALLGQMVARARRRNRALEDSNAVLSDQSVHDPLTGAFNRRHCIALMGQQEALMASRSRDRNYGACVGLILLDVDHFKHINDTWGHGAGDAVLVEIARRLQTLVRQHDVVVRWGGEEFVLVLPGTAPEGLAVLAERVLRAVAGPVAAEGQTVPVTVSAGCVAYPLFPGQPWQDGLKVADLAMYMAKHGGRNRAVCVMDVPADTAPELLSDLAGAHAAGKVAVRVVLGPAAEAVAAAS